MNFSALIKLISFFLSNRKFSVSLEGEMSTPRVMQSTVPQGSILSPALFNMYINDTPLTIGVHIALFAANACFYATERKEKLQRVLNSMAEWSKRCNT
jgi:hypothetical protein